MNTVLREIAAAFCVGVLVGVLIVLGLAVVVARKWAARNEERRQRDLPASLRGH